MYERIFNYYVIWQGGGDDVDSILTSVKKVLGIKEEYEHFDADIIMHINTVFMILNQMGIGDGSFTIQDKDAIWTDYLENGPKLEMVKTYVSAKVKMVFDPPSSSVLSEAYNKVIQELEWRLNYEYETHKEV